MSSYRLDRMFTLNSPVVRIGPWLVIVTIAFAAVAAAVSSPDAQSGQARYGGDFPSFYGAGTIVLAGDGANLYDVELQTAAQADTFSNDGLLYFAYPPFTAAAYAGLAWLSYGAAYAVHSVLAIAALVGALAMLRPFARGALDGWSRLGLASVAAIVSYPVLRSVLGGQNATFTLLGIAAVARFDRDERPIAAGVAAAALLYKPQFGLLIIGILVLSRRWASVASAAAGAVVLFVVGALVVGVDWLAVWVDAVTAFGDLNLIVNGSLMISAVGWLQNVLGMSAWSYAMAGAVVLAVGLPIAYGLASRKWSEIPWSALMPLVIVAAPSALYYDATLVLIPVVVAVAWATERVALPMVAVIALSWTQVFAAPLGWSPLFPMVAALAAIFALSALKDERIRVTPRRYTR